MQVTMRSLAAGPMGCMQPGETVNLPEDQARDFLQHGYATPADPAAEKAAREIEAETTEARREAETAALKSRGRRS